MRAIPLYLAVAVALLSAPPAAAQSTTSTKAGSAAPATASSAAVEPKAVAALERMGAYLRTLKQYSVHGDSTFDLVMEDGLRLQFPGTVDYKVRTPNALVIELKTDRKDRKLYYDGKTLTVYGPKSGYYASVDAPPTTKEMLVAAEERYGIELPLVDLFLWGAEEGSPASSLKSAMFVGPARISGTVTEQYAFRQEGVDWQIWIETGSKPLPRRLVITTTDDPTQPQYASTLTWNTNAALNDSNFTFTPPKDAKRIKLVDVAAAGDQESTP